METLTRKTQETIDIAMAYFHPEEKIFNDELVEDKMLEAYVAFYSEVGTDKSETEELRDIWFERDRAGMYDFLDKYITL